MENSPKHCWVKEANCGTKWTVRHDLRKNNTIDFLSTNVNKKEKCLKPCTEDSGVASGLVRADGIVGED